MPSLFTQPIHLGLGATALVQPDFTGMDWYAGYMNRDADDRIEGLLVSTDNFTEDWGSWEIHPKGAEVVICVAGAMTSHQEPADGSGRRSRWPQATMRSTRQVPAISRMWQITRRKCS
jgi:hypothetical protein